MATESLILLNQTTVKSCKCYEQYWKTMKTSAFPYVEFNYSIEKTLSFCIHRQDLLYHFAILNRGLSPFIFHMYYIYASTMFY